MTPSNPIEFRIGSSNEHRQPYLWRVWTRGKGRELAYSENFVSHGGATGAITGVQRGGVQYETFVGHDRRWYFRIKGRNGEIMARSSHAYSTQSQATADADLIRRNAGAAPVYDDTRVGAGRR